jgi:hypothetical protein
VLRTPAPLIGTLGVLRFYLLKVLISAVIIATVSEVSKRSLGVAALIASLPLISLLAFIWMKIEGVSESEIASLSIQIFWLVIPSLFLFVVLWAALRHGLGFWAALAMSSVSTIVLYFALLPLLRKFGVQL